MTEHDKNVCIRYKDGPNIEIQNAFEMIVWSICNKLNQIAVRSKL